MTLSERIAEMESHLTRITGQEVEITVRGDYSFTISTKAVYLELGSKVSQFFGKSATVTTAHDYECGSFSYVEVAQ